MQVQLVFTLLLVALSWFLAEDLEDWSFYRWWTAGWLALAAQILVGRVLLDLPSMSSPGEIGFAALPVLGAWEVTAFALGAVELLRGRGMGWRLATAVLVAAALAGLVVGIGSLHYGPTSFAAVALQTTPRSLGLALVFPLCAVAFRRTHRERVGVAEALVMSGFLLYGLDQAIYAWGGVRDLLSLHGGGHGAPGLNGLTVISTAAIQADLAWEAVLGVGSVLLLRREGRSVRRALRRSEARYRKLFEHSVDGILLVEERGRVVDANASALEMLDRRLSELIDVPVESLVAGGERAELEALLGSEERTPEVEVTFRRANDSAFPVELSMSSFEHAGRRVTQVILRDVTTRKELERKLAHRANHHPLTDLPNRIRFREECEEALARVHRTHSRIGLLFLDLDGFKEVNDTLGHAAGDQVLIEVGRRLAGIIRLGDAVAHVGGDEFTILLHDTLVPAQLLEAGRRALDALEESIRIGEEEVHLSASVGAAISGEQETYERIVRRADQAMYRAKREGGARIILAAADG